jgi:hypothetical protein
MLTGLIVKDRSFIYSVGKLSVFYIILEVRGIFNIPENDLKNENLLSI